MVWLLINFWAWKFFFLKQLLVWFDKLTIFLFKRDPSILKYYIIILNFFYIFNHTWASMQHNKSLLQSFQEIRCWTISGIPACGS